MHVLVISPYRYVGKDLWSAIFIKSQVDQLHRKGIKIGVIAPSPIVYSSKSIKQILLAMFTFIPNHSVEQGVPVYRFNGLFWMTSRIPYLSTTYWLLIGILEFILYKKKYGKPDLIHCHDAVYAGQLALVLKRLFGLKYMITEHNSNLIEKYSDNLVALKKKVFNNADDVIFVSKNLGNLHEKYKCVEPQKWNPIPNILSDLYITESKSFIPKISDQCNSFLHVSNLSDIKNVDKLISAFSKYLVLNPDAHLTIIGDGKNYGALTQLIKNLKIESSVFFLGGKVGLDLIDYYKRADIFIFSSIYETFGYVLIEAMSFGVPVIAINNSGGPSEIIKDSMGVLADNSSEESIFRAMVLMKEKYNDFDKSYIMEQCRLNYYMGPLTEIINKYKNLINK